MTPDSLIAQAQADVDLAKSRWDQETARFTAGTSSRGAVDMMLAEQALVAARQRLMFVQNLTDPLIGAALVHAFCAAQDVVFADDDDDDAPAGDAPGQPVHEAPVEAAAVEFLRAVRGRACYDGDVRATGDHLANLLGLPTGGAQ